MVRSVFISMGTPFTAHQADFSEALMELLRENRIDPRVMNKTDYPTGNPLKGISSVLAACDRAIVVAFERKHFPTGVEKRGSEAAVALGATSYPTPWNQIEAAMAYQRGLPILVLAEKELQVEGLLEEKYDWYVDRIDINAVALDQKTVRGQIQAWCKDLENRQTNSSLTPISSDITLTALLRAMTLKTIAQVIAIAIALLSTGFTAGRYVAPMVISQVQQPSNR